MATLTKTVLISGASIAGPAMAFWLQRHGFHPVVVEQAGAVRGGGYPIDVRGIAVDVAERMGVLPELRAARIRTRGMTLVAANGRPVRTIAAGVGEDEGSAEHDVELPRGDLTSVLYAHTRDDVEYVFDNSITGIEQRADGVEVTFRRGEPRTVDLVVGADGMHSNVRGLTFGADERFHRPLGYYFAAFSAPNELGLDHEALVYNSPGKMVGLNAVRDDGRVLAIFAFASPPLEYDTHDVEQQWMLMEKTFAGVRWEAPRLLRLMREADDFYFDSAGQILMPGWTDGRVALVGDAGYAPSLLSGQGTSLALVGAYVLAGELAAAGGDHRIALPAYEREMRRYVERNQRVALVGARHLIPATRTQIWMRNHAMRLPQLFARANVLGKSLQQAATSMSLRSYAQPGAIEAQYAAPDTGPCVPRQISAG